MLLRLRRGSWLRASAPAVSSRPCAAQCASPEKISIDSAPAARRKIEVAPVPPDWAALSFTRRENAPDRERRQTPTMDPRRGSRVRPHPPNTHTRTRAPPHIRSIDPQHRHGT